MRRSGSIGLLSAAYTVGTAAGMLVPGQAWAAAAAGIILPLMSLPLLLRRRLAALDPDRALLLITGLFTLCGILGAALVRLSPGFSETPSFLADAGESLRGFIGTLPFSHEGTAPLRTALFTGDRSGLGRETVRLFRSSGASHILALSGLHMGILYLIFDRLSSLAGNSRGVLIVRFILIIAGALAFTLVTGAPPSLVRAFLFIAINETLRLLGRPRNGVRVLSLALLVQLIISPGVILQPGFQLSYLAMCGIFILYPRMEAWYPEGGRLSPLRTIWKSAALSISCQLFTAPLVWYYFRSFPQYFLLTNLLAMPLTTLIMTTALACMVLSAAGICPAFLYTTTDALCNLLQGVLEIISSM